MTDFVELGDADFAVLFPEEDYEIGKTTLTLRPLNLEDTAHLVAAVRADFPQLMADFQERGISLATMEANMAAVGEVVIHRVPIVLSILTGLGPESVMKLPLTVAINLFRKVMEVNLRDQDFFEILSAAKDAADKFNKMMAAGTSVKGSRGQRQGSLKRGTTGKKYGRTRGGN